MILLLKFRLFLTTIMPKLFMWKLNIVSWRNNFVAILRQNHQLFRLKEIRLNLLSVVEISKNFKNILRTYRDSEIMRQVETGCRNEKEKRKPFLQASNIFSNSIISNFVSALKDCKISTASRAAELESLSIDSYSELKTYVHWDNWRRNREVKEDSINVKIAVAQKKKKQTTY